MNIDELTKYMDDLKDLQAKLKFDLKNTEKEIEKTELQLQEILKKENADTLTYACYCFGWKNTSRRAFDQKLFGEKFPDLYEQFKIEKMINNFFFKINK